MPMSIIFHVNRQLVIERRQKKENDFRLVFVFDENIVSTLFSEFSGNSRIQLSNRSFNMNESNERFY